MYVVTYSYKRNIFEQEVLRRQSIKQSQLQLKMNSDNIWSIYQLYLLLLIMKSIKFGLIGWIRNLSEIERVHLSGAMNIVTFFFICNRIEYLYVHFEWLRSCLYPITISVRASYACMGSLKEGLVSCNVALSIMTTTYWIYINCYKCTSTKNPRQITFSECEQYLETCQFWGSEGQTTFAIHIR